MFSDGRLGSNNDEKRSEANETTTKLCDLSCNGGVARWLDLTIAGRVVMFLGGPSCETWGVLCFYEKPHQNASIASMWNTVAGKMDKVCVQEVLPGVVVVPVSPAGVPERSGRPSAFRAPPAWIRRA